MILANPQIWFPWVDQVDRPYFVAIDKESRVYSEFTRFDESKPVDATQNNWYENVDKSNLRFFMIRGRFGTYYIDFRTGAIHAIAQHEVGDHSVKLVKYDLVINDIPITGEPYPFKLKHFKVSDVELMGSSKPVMAGMNCTPREIAKPPVFKSQTEEVWLGWELTRYDIGRVTFMAGVQNRFPALELRILFTPLDKLEVETQYNVMLSETSMTNSDRRDKTITMKTQGEKVGWQEKIM